MRPKPDGYVKKTLYVDMDNVLVDFSSAAARVISPVGRRVFPLLTKRCRTLKVFPFARTLDVFAQFGRHSCRPGLNRLGYVCGILSGRIDA